MGTRGCCGFRYQGQDYLKYNHWDSYPDGLGKNLVSEFCSRDEKHVELLISNCSFSPGYEKGTNLFDDLEKGSILHESEFIKQWDCEWAYIFNFDTRKFEVYTRHWSYQIGVTDEECRYEDVHLLWWANIPFETLFEKSFDLEEYLDSLPCDNDDDECELTL